MARPRVDLTDAQLRQIEVLAGYGLPEEAIAHAIGVAPRTFDRRKADSSAVAEAIQRGRAKAQGIVGEALFKRAKNGDVPAIKWWEQTRLGYRDAQSIEHAGPEGEPIPFAVELVFVEPGE